MEGLGSDKGDASHPIMKKRKFSSTSEEVVRCFYVPQHLIDFCKQATACHDVGHDTDHALAVFMNAIYIIESEGIQLDETSSLMLPFVMIGHDFRDHKMISANVPSLSEDEIRSYYTLHLGSELANEVLHIHDNCSWSNRGKSKPYHGDGKRDILRLLLQDADWMEAIGEVGIWRCQVYSERFQPEIAQDSKRMAHRICCHMYEKLLRIPTCFNFRASQIAAEALSILPMLDYLKKNDMLLPKLGTRFNQITSTETLGHETPLVDFLRFYFSSPEFSQEIGTICGAQ